MRLFTDDDGSRRGTVFTVVCLSVCPSHISITDAARIAKLGIEIFFEESWKPVYFEVRSPIKVTSHKKHFRRGSLHSCECCLLVVFGLVWLESWVLLFGVAVLQRPSGGNPGTLGSVCLSDGTCLRPELICARGLLCVCAPAYYNRSGQCGKSMIELIFVVWKGRVAAAGLMAWQTPRLALSRDHHSMNIQWLNRLVARFLRDSWALVLSTAQHIRTHMPV